MAVGFGTPVVAPDLASIRELTSGHPRILYRDLDELSETLSQVDRAPKLQPRPVSALADRWPCVAAAYRDVAGLLASRSDGSLP